MSVYTRTGDNGTTGLLGGVRRAKSDTRIEAIGSVDELNAHIGLCICMLPATIADDIRDELTAVQSNLFSLGSNLAVTSLALLKRHARATGYPAPIIPNKPTATDVTALEKAIDRYDMELSRLTGFIIPGGSPSAAHLHIARSVCRRAERRLVGIKMSAIHLKYINRLSDYLFTCARVLNARLQVHDSPWIQ